MRKPISVKPVIDRLLTFILSIVVILSLILSGMIWAGTPFHMSSNRLGFFTTPNYGHTSPTNVVFQPQSIYYWTGDNQLYRVGSNPSLNTMVMNALGNVQILPGRFLPSSSYQQFPLHGPYVRLNFGDSILTNAMMGMLFAAIPSKLPPVIDGSLYLSTMNHHEILSYRTTKQRIYKANLLVPKGFYTSLHRPSFAIPYVQIPLLHGVISLPYTAITMKLEERAIVKPKVVHLLNAYFSDPSLLQTRTFANGLKWYTDGFHSVIERQSPYGEQITYQSPSGYVSHLPVNEADAINTAVNFVNDHGGFTGQVSLRIISSFQQAAPITVALQQVIDGWSVFGSFSRQVVTIQNNAVISMQTPLSYMGSIIDEQTVTILSGTSFLHHLTNKQLDQVTSIAIGYGTKVTNFGTLQLIPVYQVMYGANHVVYYDAHTGEIFNDVGM